VLTKPKHRVTAVTTLSDNIEIGCFVKCGMRAEFEPNGGAHDTLQINLTIPGTMLRGVQFDGERLDFEVLGAVERKELARALRWLARRLDAVDDLAAMIH